MKRKQAAVRKEKYLTADEENCFDDLWDKSPIAFASPGKFIDTEVAKMMGESYLADARKRFKWSKPKRVKPYSSDMHFAWQVFNWAVSRNFRQRRDFFKAVKFLTGGCLSCTEILVEYRKDMPGLICRAALIAHLNGKEHKSQERNKEDFFG